MSGPIQSVEFDTGLGRPEDMGIGRSLRRKPQLGAAMSFYEQVMAPVLAKLSAHFSRSLSFGRPRPGTKIWEMAMHSTGT